MNLKLLAIPASIACVMNPLHAAFAQEIVNDVPIIVAWSEPIAPQDVSFDSADSGELAFEPGTGLFKGQRRGEGSWLNHKISVHYANFSMPLELRTWHKQGELRLNVQLWQVGCNQDDIARIMSVRPSSSQRETVGAIIAARYISKMPTNRCPSPVARQMAQVYYNLSCNLSKKLDFFALSEDAIEAYRETAGTGPDQALSCAVQSRGVALKSLDGAYRQAIVDKSWPLAENYAQELRKLIQSTEWNDAFEAISLDRTSIEALDVKRIYLQSLEESDAGNYVAAMDFNRELLERAADEDNEAAFAMVRLDRERLEDDAGYFETRMQQMIAASESEARTPEQ